MLIVVNNSAWTATRSSPTAHARAPHDAEQLYGELTERRQSDIERGFTGHGPHRDDLSTTREGHELRAYGSQGQQRLALLALLLAERAAIASSRDAPPVMLLDDVMSELDQHRRRSLVDLLRGTGGQSVITATDLEQVPGASEPGVVRLAVAVGPGARGGARGVTHLPSRPALAGRRTGRAGRRSGA